MVHPQERVSPQEMSRRHARVREKMEEAGLNLLLVSGLRFVASMGYLRYLSNWAEPFAGECLLFPREGEPLFCARTAERALLVEELLGLKAATGSTAAAVAPHIEKTGEKRVGLCGLKTMTAEFHQQLRDALPQVALEDVSWLLDALRMVKSDEELGWVRKSARLGDLAWRTFAGMVEEGRKEAEVLVEVDHLVRRFGGEQTYFMFSADPQPVPKFWDLAFDGYQAGDLVMFNAEIAGPAGYYSQLVRLLSLGEPKPEAKEAYAVCQAALEAGQATLKPGRSPQETYQAVRAAIEQGGFPMGLHPGHSQGLDIFERPLVAPQEEAVYQENMVIVLHPHALLPSGGGVWVGETFVLGEGGARRLHASPREMLVL